MTDLHPLTPLLAPRSVAIFGASNDRERISGRSLRYFLEAGYSGALYPINPNRDTVQGVPAYPDLASVPGSVDGLPRRCRVSRASRRRSTANSPASTSTRCRSAPAASASRRSTR